MSARQATISLYRNLLRAGKSFHDYNFREYTVRRVREEFRKNIDLTGEQLDAAIKKAQDSLALVRRQATIGNMYSHGKYFIETD